jgi:chitodextrinase
MEELSVKKLLFRQLLIVLSVVIIFQTFTLEKVMAEDPINSSNTYPVNAKDKDDNSYQKINSVRTKKGSKVVEAIKLETYSGNKSSSINTLFPRYKIYNNGNTPIKLSNIKIRYYYTINGESTQNFWCDWSNIGNSNIVGKFVKIPAQTEGVDYCLEITFKESAGLLKQNDCVELQCRIDKSDGTKYIQPDDYSFNTASSSYTDWNKVTGYINDKLIYGVEPITTPQNINVTALSKEITLNWDKSSSCTGYEVEVDGVLVKNITSNTYTHTNLVPGTKHTYRVRLRNAIIAGPWSNTVTGIVPISDKFNIVQTTSESAISISWDKIEGAQQYFVEVDGETIDNGQKTSYRIDGLQPGTQRSIRIQAKGEALLGEWSDMLEIWTLPEMPAYITTTSSKSTITLTWEKVRGAAGYDVEVYGSPEDNSNKTSYTQYDLQANSQRTYRVRAKNSSGVGQWSEVVAATTLPDSALNIQLQAAVNDLKVTWDAQAGATAYELEIDGSKIIEINQNAYIHSDLQPNTIHTYRARPKNENGTGEWSELVTGVTLLPIPSKFKVSSVSSSVIALSWDSVQGASGYDIEVDGEIFNNDNKTEFVHKMLGSNQEHVYKVRARNEQVLGAWTEEIKKSTLLASPKNLKVTVSGNEVKIEWDMVVGADGYGIEIDGKETRLGANTDYTLTALEPGVEHTYRVRAYKGDEVSEWGDTNTKTSKLGTPSNITVTTQSSISIDINWDDVEGASAYDVMVDGKVFDNGEKSGYSHIDLKPNTLHTYMVRAKDNDNIGEWSSKISAFTNVATPAGIVAVAQSKSIALTWDEVDGAESYDIIADGEIINTKADTLYKHIELEPNTKHYYRIRAKNINGMSEWSPELEQSTGPNVPINFKVGVTINEAVLTWETTTSGAISFDVEADGEIITDVTESSYTIANLEPNTRHEYRVRAKNKDGVYSEWSELLGVNTKEELIINVDKDLAFNFVIAVPKKEGIDSYDIVVNYNPDDVDVIDLYATTQKLDLETGKIEDSNISIKGFSDGKIVFSVDNPDKSVIVIVRFMSKTNKETKMSYTVE